MPDGVEGEKLAATRQVVVVLRLVVEASGKVLHGEVVASVTGDAYRFAGLRSVSAAVRRWLADDGRRSLADPTASDALEPPAGRREG